MNALDDNTESIDGLLNAGGITKGGGSKNAADGSTRQNVGAPGATKGDRATKKTASTNVNKGGARGTALKERPKDTPKKYGQKPVPPKKGEKPPRKQRTDDGQGAESKASKTAKAKSATQKKDRNVSTQTQPQKPQTKKQRTRGRGRNPDKMRQRDSSNDKNAKRQQ